MAANPFHKINKNAVETKKTYDSERKNASNETRCCPQCGAPRPLGADLRTCSYCGFEFMTIDTAIKTKPS